MPYFDWNHHNVYYRQKGSGPLLILLPGNTSSSVNMQAELSYFSNRYMTTSLDFLGTGRSDRIEIWADDWWLQGAHQVRQLVRELGQEESILIGTSGGAVIALLTAIHYPEIVRAVVADSFIPYLTKTMLEGSLIPDRMNPNSGQIMFWEAAHGPYWRRVVEADTIMIERFVRRGGDWFIGKLTQVKCPTLLTGSKADPVLPGVAGYMAEMAGEISRSRVYLHDKGVHPFIWSAPGIFRNICDIFLISLEQEKNG
jgi:pimeloyl-ACP methyl ester carboxylesterase